MVAVGWWLRWRGRLFDTRWYLRACQLAIPARLSSRCSPAGRPPKSGRQPWTVYGLLRTANSVSPSLTGADVSCRFVGYVVVYLFIFPTGVLFMLRHGAQRPRGEAAPAPVESGRPQIAGRRRPRRRNRGGR